MVMDDLSVKPLSTISGITLLNTFNVRDLDSLGENTVNLSMPEVVNVNFESLVRLLILLFFFFFKLLSSFRQDLKLLKASLHSKTVLNYVLLHLTYASSLLHRCHHLSFLLIVPMFVLVYVLFFCLFVGICHMTDLNHSCMCSTTGKKV